MSSTRKTISKKRKTYNSPEELRAATRREALTKLARLARERIKARNERILADIGDEKERERIKESLATDCSMRDVKWLLKSFRGFPSPARLNDIELLAGIIRTQDLLDEAIRGETELEAAISANPQLSDANEAGLQDVRIEAAKHRRNLWSLRQNAEARGLLDSPHQPEDWKHQRGARRMVADDAYLSAMLGLTNVDNRTRALISLFAGSSDDFPERDHRTTTVAAIIQAEMSAIHSLRKRLAKAIEAKRPKPADNQPA